MFQFPFIDLEVFYPTHKHGQSKLRAVKGADKHWKITFTQIYLQIQDIMTYWMESVCAHAYVQNICSMEAEKVLEYEFIYYH